MSLVEPFGLPGALPCPVDECRHGENPSRMLSMGLGLAWGGVMPERWFQAV